MQMHIFQPMASVFPGEVSDSPHIGLTRTWCRKFPLPSPRVGNPVDKHRRLLRAVRILTAWGGLDGLS